MAEKFECHQGFAADSDELFSLGMSRWCVEDALTYDIGNCTQDPNPKPTRVALTCRTELLDPDLHQNFCWERRKKVGFTEIINNKFPYIWDMPARVRVGSQWVKSYTGSRCRRCILECASPRRVESLARGGFGRNAIGSVTPSFPQRPWHRFSEAIYRLIFALRFRIKNIRIYIIPNPSLVYVFFVLEVTGWSQRISARVGVGHL